MPVRNKGATLRPNTQEMLITLNSAARHMRNHMLRWACKKTDTQKYTLGRCKKKPPRHFIGTTP